MDDNQDNSVPDYSIVIHEDINEVYSVRESICPLCQSIVSLFQIHFDEKFLMCSNTECSYPFGTADCHIYKIDCIDEFTRAEGRSTAGCSSFTSGSTVSLADWTDMETSMQLDSIRPPSTIEEPQELEKLAKIKELEKSEIQLRKNVKEIHELNKSLSDPAEKDNTIVNEKWIRRIADMEERSGVQLLKKDEIMRMKKKEPKCVAKLDINIDASEDTISVKIGVGEENAKK